MRDEDYMTDELSTRKPPTRTNRRSALSIIKAAKATGCAAVEFPDGTIVRITPDTAPAATNGAASEVDRWFNDHAN